VGFVKAIQDIDGRWVMSLHRGESIRDEIEGLACREGILGAKLSAIGAIEDPEIGGYDLDKREYHRRTFDGLWELLSFQGNISMLEGKAFMHAHITVSGHDFKVFGGHLFDARVGVVTEVFLEPLTVPLPRVYCEAIGLARLEPLEL
jgi:predicted DNA-binding protein with PD1-like motif